MQVSVNRLKSMKKEKFVKFKGRITITKRKVPFWLSLFQRFGLFRKAGKIVSIKEYKNIFTTVGKYSLLDRMKGDTKGEITYLALGDGLVAPAVGDTTLGNELFRKLITQRTRTLLVFYTSTFLMTTEGNYTYKEAGLFGDAATATTNSGTLFTRLAIDEVKTSGESLTIDYNIVAT